MLVTMPVVFILDGQESRSKFDALLSSKTDIIKSVCHVFACKVCTASIVACKTGLSSLSIVFPQTAGSYRGSNFSKGGIVLANSQTSGCCSECCAGCWRVLLRVLSRVLRIFKRKIRGQKWNNQRRTTPRNDNTLESVEFTPQAQMRAAGAG